MRKTMLAMLLGIVVAPVGADTFRIEIDYMVGAGHSHEPAQAELDAVIQMFACQGHTLIIEKSDALTHYNVLRKDPDNCSGSLFSYSGVAASYGQIKADNFDHAGEGGWHYCIFGHQYEDNTCTASGSSGLANAGIDLVVTLGTFSGSTGTPFDRAATLAHEFGHNLGLSHCGAQVCGSDTSDPDYVGPYPPNLPSIMSYRYQLAGVKFNMLCNGLAMEESLFKDMDYSHGRMCLLDEDDLDERMGTGMIWTDFDCDGSIESSVAQDINGGNSGWCSATGNRTLQVDYDEWGNLVDSSFLPRSPNPEDQEEFRRRQEFVWDPCITSDEWEQVQREIEAAGGCGQTTLATESCINGENIYIGEFLLLEAGTCIFPYDSVQQAHDASPTRSVFYLAPGTYNESGTVVLDKRGKYFCERRDGGSSAVIR